MYNNTTLLCKVSVTMLKVACLHQHLNKNYNFSIICVNPWTKNRHEHLNTYLPILFSNINAKSHLRFVLLLLLRSMRF